MNSNHKTKCGEGPGHAIPDTCVSERIDEKGARWYVAYCGGGAHFRNWLAQCREIGEVMVEEIEAAGYACFEEGGEKLYRIWVKRPWRRNNT